MWSRTVEGRREYWARYRRERLPYAVRECVGCGGIFKPRGPQKRCEACLTHTCIVCGALFRAPGRTQRKTCSRRCAALQPHVVERINKNRGVKPRTYAKTRGKHGSAEDREWRAAVFARDDFTCQTCGQRGGRLQADHIKPYADHPELRHVLSNGRTLCIPCHQRTPTYGWGLYWRRKIAAKRLSQEVLPLVAQ